MYWVYIALFHNILLHFLFLCCDLGVKADLLHNNNRHDTPEIVPLYISKQEQRRSVVNLLLISSALKSHYVLIKNINTLLMRRGSKNPISICLNCFTRFYGPSRHDVLKEHKVDCYKNEPAKITFPRDKVLRFTNIKAQSRYVCMLFFLKI